MKILRARHLGMCFGVRDAIRLAQRESRQTSLTVLGDLVHNEAVLDDLRRRGIRLERDLARVETEAVLVTAHGTSDRRRAEILQRGHRLLEATCPLVKFAHQRIADLVRDGCFPVIIGQRDHVEVRGLTGDLDAFAVILDEGEIPGIPERPVYGVASQTTQPPERVERLVEALRRHFPRSEVRFADTVCRPTRDRQSAAREVAAASDVVIVVGGSRSNNTRELVATCQQLCDRVYHVQTAADLSEAWFQPDDTVGLTAGTSTPDDVVDAVEHRIRDLADSASEAGKLVDVPGRELVSA